MKRDLHDLNFFHRDKPPTDKRPTKKSNSLNYKKYNILLNKGGDMKLNNTQVKKQCPTVAEILASPISKFITISEHNFGYGGTAEYLVVNYFHPLFLKAKAEESRDYNPNWHEATTDLFANKDWEQKK